MSAIKAWLGNKKTRSKIEEMLTDTGHLGLSVQKLLADYQWEKSLLDCLSCGIDLRYIIYTFTNCLLKKLLKSLIITLKGHLSL